MRISRSKRRPFARLDQSVAFDSPTSLADDYGGEISGWTQAHACYAGFIYKSGSEAVVSAGLAGKKTYTVKIPRCTGAEAIDSTYRMRDLRREPLSGVGDDTLPGARYNIRVDEDISDPMFIYLIVESGVAV